MRAEKFFCHARVTEKRRLHRGFGRFLRRSGHFCNARGTNGRLHEKSEFAIVQSLKDQDPGRWRRDPDAPAEQPAEYRFPDGVPFGKPSPEKGVFLPRELAKSNAN